MEYDDTPVAIEAKRRNDYDLSTRFLIRGPVVLEPPAPFTHPQ